jgi:hypothetical protein
LPYRHPLECAALSFVAILASAPSSFSIRLHAAILRRFVRSLAAIALIGAGLACTWPSSCGERPHAAPTQLSRTGGSGANAALKPGGSIFAPVAWSGGL